MNNSVQRFTPLAITIGFFVFWEFAAWLLKVDVFILPRPTVIMASMYQHAWVIFDNSAQTFMTTILGFGLAVVVGLLLGMLVGASPKVYQGIYPILVGLNSIPKVAIVPILVIWFGIGSVPAVLTAFSIAFFPIMVNVATGLAAMEAELKDVLRSLGARKSQILWKVGIPRSMPFFFASLKVAIGMAFIGSVVSETMAANKGIGYLMMTASARFDVPLVFAGLFVIGLMGVGMYEFFAKLEKRVTFWAVRDNEIVA